jgi:pyruvate dehydrogenase E2 component (dihydrolipoamide acetyltransferase)
MAVAVTMPRLGLSMAEGTVVEWHVPPGGAVERGALLLTVESEKAEVEVEAFASGVLAAVFVEPGTTVPVGTLLGAIASTGEAFDPAAFSAGFVPPREESAPATERAAPAPPRPAGDEPKAAPAARALARRLGIELASVTGTGPSGRITVEDVERAAGGATLDAASGLGFVRAGSGPPVLFLPGYGTDTSMWRRQLDGLASGFKVIACDHRGIGGSRPLPAGSVGLADLAADSGALLASLGHRPAVVVGASMGAAVALELALADPDAVSRLVLVAPLLEPDARFAAVLRAWRAHENPTSEARIRTMLPWLFGRDLLAHAGRREAAVVALRTMAARTPADTLARHADALVAWLGTRAADLARLTLPVLIVSGSDDALTPSAQADAVAAALPNARVKVLPGAGHSLAIERAAEVNGLIRGFVAEA